MRPRGIDNLTMIERIRENEELAGKFHEVESRILSVLNFRDFFEVLLTEISEIFDIPMVWFSLIEDHEVSQLIRQFFSAGVLRERMSLIDRDAFRAITRGQGSPLLVDEGLLPYAKLCPAGWNQRLGSMALVPVTIDGELVGSLNLADRSKERYRPGLNTVFIERLALKVSLCLSNVTAHEKLKKVAHHDPLTDLLNRRAMEGILHREFDRARRHNRPLSLVFLDLDDFKLVNDTYGHDCGDELLKHLAKGMLDMCRGSDVVTRYAGDEFVLILPETPPEKAERLMSRIQTVMRSRPLAFEGNTVSVTTSFGVATSMDASIADPAGLLKAADKLLYRDKQERKQESPT